MERIQEPLVEIFIWRESMNRKVIIYNWEVLCGVNSACMTSESEVGGGTFLKEMKAEFLDLFWNVEASGSIFCLYLFLLLVVQWKDKNLRGWKGGTLHRDEGHFQTLAHSSKAIH